MNKNLLWILALIVVSFFSFKLGQSSVHCEKVATATEKAEGACGLPVIQPPPPPPPTPNSSHM